MKKLRITVNGKAYDVTVEVLEDDEKAYPGALPLGQDLLAASRAPIAPARPPVPHDAAPAASGPLVHDPDAIAAPLAGTVRKIFVQQGQPVEEKTPVVMLDAMKMDTYIYAPKSGHVAEVSVAVGAAVQVGDILMRYTPGS